MRAEIQATMRKHSGPGSRKEGGKARCAKFRILKKIPQIVRNAFWASIWPSNLEHHLRISVAHQKTDGAQMQEFLANEFQILAPRFGAW